ncbi:DNA-binding protein inhibitor ID-2 [Solea senegalensis]|uniref:DNA-binding protein inhibitor ID-4 n=1 Tax=Solea senegalensis TaxID=28829 RepID=A0AAV6S1F8_SOLSE|nr:DNA-binding protein inhibitor ID-2 [Solea senegalensis]
MKAISPVRSFRKSSGVNYSEHSLGISRSKTPVDDPLSLLYNMNDCYSKLKELVPSIPQNKNVSKMEILQHVIDYILDLQIALDSSTSASCHYSPRSCRQSCGQMTAGLCIVKAVFGQDARGRKKRKKKKRRTWGAGLSHPLCPPPPLLSSVL